MQMFIILILAGVGGWLIWDRVKTTEQLDAANVSITKLKEELDGSKKQTQMAMMEFAKAAPAQAQAIAKRLDSQNGVVSGAANSISKIVPKMTEMEKRREQGGTMLDPQPAGGRR